MVISDSGATNGRLIVRHGSTITNFGIAAIGASAGHTGSATVTGANSMWTNWGNLSVGDFGNGTLNIEAGGKVTNSWGYIGNGTGSTGTATVTGANSTWTNSNSLWVGVSGNGTLLVEAGGKVTSWGGDIGYYSGPGKVTVTGANSSWIGTPGSFLVVGFNGNAALRVEAGGTVTNFVGIIGDVSTSTSTATVTGANSTWSNSSTLKVGPRGGNGTLRVEAGGTVTNVSAYIGRAPDPDYSGGMGDATVTGTGSKWASTGDLFVGGNDVAPGGSGQLYVSDSGLVEVTGALKIWNTGSLTVDTAGSVTAGGLTSGGLLEVYDADVASPVTLLAGSQLFADNATFDDLEQQAGAQMHFELRSTSDFDNLTVDNLAALAGSLVVSLDGGFQPAVGATFEILTASSRSGMFQTPDFTAAPLGSGLAWDVLYSPTSVVLAVVTESPNGDFDGDGDVDGSDFLKWQRGESPLGVDGLDLAQWKTFFGTTPLPTASVPEPSAAALGGTLAMLGLLAPRRLVRRR